MQKPSISANGAKQTLKDNMEEIIELQSLSAQPGTKNKDPARFHGIGSCGKRRLARAWRPMFSTPFKHFDFPVRHKLREALGSRWPVWTKVSSNMLMAFVFSMTVSAQDASEQPKKKRRPSADTAESTPKPSKKSTDEDATPAAKKKTKQAVNEEDETEPAAKPALKKKKQASSAVEEEPSASPKPRKKPVAAAPDEPVKKKQVEESNADADEADAASAKLRKKAAAPGESATAGAPDSSKEARSAAGKAASALNATVEPDQIVEYAGLSEPVRKLIDASLALTRKNLTYTYGSADPANGGMDCSGTIYYLLKQAGFADVPRDASGLYSWARKEGKFFAVISKKDGGFEFNDLKPGDLLFWNGTYTIDRDPPVTHVMIYLGTEKGRKKRIMVGASDGRTYDGKSRWGVSVFDFVMPHPRPGETVAKADFLGYARIPSLGQESSEPEKVKQPEPERTTESKPAKEEQEKPAAKTTSKPRSSGSKSKTRAKSSN